MNELTFEANLPEDTKMPVKPMKGLTTAGKRRVRVWLDAWLSPGESEMLLLLEEETFDVTIRRRPKTVIGAKVEAAGEVIPFSDEPEAA